MATVSVQHHQMYAAGEWIDAAGALEIRDPATEELVATVARGTTTDVDRAVAAARASFESGVWSRMPQRERARIMQRMPTRSRSAWTSCASCRSARTARRSVRPPASTSALRPRTSTTSPSSPARTRSRSRSPGSSIRRWRATRSSASRSACARRSSRGTSRSCSRCGSINFKGCMRVTQAVLPAMVEQGFGRVVSIGSDAGRIGSSLESVYSGTKGAVIAFTKTIARKWHGRA